MWKLPAESQLPITADSKALRIVKVGGSLLDWPELKERLADWLAADSTAATVLIAGGGNFTDAVRRAQAVHHFDDEAAHWMCVQALSASAQLLSVVLPNAKLAISLDEMHSLSRPAVPQIVFDPATFLRQEEPRAPGRPLPHDWTATSDSIAARVARLTGAGELVLLKSADPPPHGSLAELAAKGYVDQHFPLAAGELPVVRFVNLRALDTTTAAGRAVD